MVQRKGLFLAVFCALVIIPIAVFVLSKITNPQKENPRTSLESVVQAIEKIEESPLKKITEEQLLSKNEEYGVVIKNLKTGENFSLNENKEFQSASLYKLWIMGVAFQKINDGVLNENETLSAPIIKLDEILTETTPTPNISQEPTPTPSPTPEESRFVTMTAKDAIEKMITISDNYAALLIASRSGSLSVTNFLKEYEFNNSNFRQPPKTTAGDLGKYFEKLYGGEIVSVDYSAEMIEVLKKQTVNDRIPKYLPKEISVAHKTGELKEYKHDAGIVFTKKADYVIVVLSNTRDPYKASEKIAKFSKAVYDYFQKL